MPFITFSKQFTRNTKTSNVFRINSFDSNLHKFLGWWTTFLGCTFSFPGKFQALFITDHLKKYEMIFFFLFYENTLLEPNKQLHVSSPHVSTLKQSNNFVNAWLKCLLKTILTYIIRKLTETVFKLLSC